MSWARIRSWHLTHLTYSPPGGASFDWVVRVRTLCGRLVELRSPTLAKPPEDERTCERCFQIREGR